MVDHEEVTRLLDQAMGGRDSAAERLLTLVYNELRGLAARYMANQPAGHTLQATALVHEVYLRLLGSGDRRWESRAHFFAVAAKAMRQVLADHARTKRREKRGGDRARVTLNEAVTPDGGADADLVALDEALTDLAALDERKARLIELRFFVGLTIPEAAHALGVSTATLDRDWRTAQAWLSARLAGDKA